MGFMMKAVRWLFSLPASMFYCLAASALFEGLASPSGMARFAALLAEFFLPSSIALWVLADARRRHRAVHYDFGTFVCFAWPVLVPIYLFSTRGWRAFTTLGWFLLLYVAAAVASMIPSLFSAHPW
jgi:hypothetical protein